MTVTVGIPVRRQGDSAQRPDEQQQSEQDEKQPKPKNKYLKFIGEQWLVCGFGLACLFAYLWPNVAATGGVIKSEYTILYGSVAVIFLCSGLQLSPEKLRANLFNWRLHIIVQGISFIVIPATYLAIMWIIIAAGDLKTQVIDIPVLLGMLVLSCLPTTIASNVVMTRNAGGDDSAAIIEVVIGNVFGSFMCPALIYALIPNRPEFQQWAPASPATLGDMYQKVAMQLGLSVLVPLIVGQTLRTFFGKQVTWCIAKFHLPKISTFFLCTLIWSTFSNAFKSGALYRLPKASIIFNIFMNIGLYALFTGICFCMARPPRALVKRAIDSRVAGWSLPLVVRRFILPKQVPKEQAVAVCFCGAAKTTSVGIPLVAAMWTDKDELMRASLEIPVLLYTMEQVFLAQGLVYVFKWYLKRNKHSDMGDPEYQRGGIDDVDGADERNIERREETPTTDGRSLGR